MQARACALSLRAAGQGGGWARAGAEAIAALVDLSAAEVRELLGAGDGAGVRRSGAPALAQRAAHMLAGLDGALADGAGRARPGVGARAGAGCAPRRCRPLLRLLHAQAWWGSLPPRATP